MVFIKEQTKEINCKIVYYGPPFCGKSTALRFIFEQTKDGHKGNLVSLSEKEERTLYFDFVPIRLGTFKNHQIRLHLYTVPGEVGYKAARKIISKGVDGVVFMADSKLQRLEENMKSFLELKEMVEEEDISFQDLPLVVLYNKRDLPDAVSVTELKRLLNPMKAPDFETIATQGKGVMESLKVIAKNVLKNLK